MTTENSALMEALEPCPHDLGEADFDVDQDEWEIARVVCKVCGAAGPYVLLGDHDTVDRAKAAAAKLWNKRPGMSNADRAQPDLLLSHPTQSSGAEDALAKGLCLLDSFAGEGLGHVYGNGQTIDADDCCLEVAEAFGVEFGDGWYRKVAAIAARPAPLPAEREADGEVAGLREAVENLLHVGEFCRTDDTESALRKVRSALSALSAQPVSEQGEERVAHGVRMGARYLMQAANAGRITEDEIVRVIMDRLSHFNIPGALQTDGGKA
jgi:hypothetical protein